MDYWYTEYAFYHGTQRDAWSTRIVKMSTAMLVTLMVLLALQLNAQLTVDDNGGSCESSTSDQVVNVIREELKVVKQLREDFQTTCASNQQQSVAVCVGLC